MVACPVCHTAYADGGLEVCSRCGSGMGAPVRVSNDDADAWIGKTVDGRYRILSRIGAGGMGMVYRIEHVRMGKVAAMKVLHRELAGDAAAVKRFRREVEAVSRLNHPNIVQTFDFGQWDGLLYLIMELVSGEDLGALLRREGAMPLPRALPLFVQVCSALDEAHHLGVIHRDLKPENIVAVRRRNEAAHAKVLDFGLAKLRERPDVAEITGKGNIIGTPYFISPEQVRSENVDARADIYSLGATMYRVVTGRYPFEGDTPLSILSKHVTDTLVPPSLRAPERNLSPALDRVLLKAMARDPARRYASAAELRRALEELAAAPATSRPRLTPRPDADDELLPSVALGGPETPDADPIEDLDRLRREDLDAFERRPRRRRWTAYAAPALLLALTATALATYRLLGSRPTQAEVEPNDEPRTANLLPRNAAVAGHVNAPQSDDEPDLDYYRIPAGDGKRAVTAHLTGIPDLDLVLELYDDTGARLAKVDGGRAGDGEFLGPVAIGARDVYLRARPLWTAGEPPTQGSETPYALVVDWFPPRGETELEPNDSSGDATAIAADGKVRGHLSSADDQDWFKIKVPAGSILEGEVEGIDGVDIVVHVGARTRVDDGELGEDEVFVATPGADGMVIIGISERAPRGAGKRTTAAQREEPYTLELRAVPAPSRRR